MHLYRRNQQISRSKLTEAEPKFDSFAVKAFNIWAKYADAKIVFSTNWATAPNMSVDRLKEIMDMNGLEFNYHEEILTPKKFTSQRGSEVWWWLLENAQEGDKFIAVDDDTSCRYITEYIDRAHDGDYVEVKNFTGKWIEVDFSDGLTWKNFNEGCEALGIDLDDINEQEFGIKKLTPEEKAKQEKMLELLARCAF